MSVNGKPPLGLYRSVSGKEQKTGLGILLAARSSSSSRRSSEKAEEAAHVPSGLRPGETVDTEGIAGRPIFIIRDTMGAPVGVRKVATSMDPHPGHFTATQVEARIYNHLVTVGEWREHILPFRGEKTTVDTVTIDFDWLDGEDAEKYLAKHPSEFLPVMRQILLQLRWLAQQGYVHGDIKLDNFYRAADGRILLFDFGRTGRVGYPSMMSELMAVARIIQPHNAGLATWLQFHAIDEHAHIASFKDKLAEIYLRTVSKLMHRRKSSSNSKSRKRSSSNRAKGAGARKSRKSSSSNRSR